MSTKKKLNIKLKTKKFIDDNFGFENKVDISDECAVLYRRNIVIKNVIFLSNVIYTVILMILSFGETSNWVLTIILFPITFIINSTLKKLISSDPENITKQTIAMYFACFYMFASAVLIYFKLKTGSQLVFRETGYILIYYALIVVALYQDSKMLKTVAKWVLALVTLLHFTITYNIIGKDYATDLWGMIKGFFSSPEVKDILLRTILLIAFMCVLTITVSIAEYMQEERKKELVKRKRVQDDFSETVREMFDVSLSSEQIPESEKEQSDLLYEMCERLASIVGLNPTDAKIVAEYSNIHLSKHVDLNLEGIYGDDQFEKLRVQTILGNKIIKRLELRRKSSVLTRVHFENYHDENFIYLNKNHQYDMQFQIILLCEIYLNLRIPLTYKRAVSHDKSIDFIKENFEPYFDHALFNRFMKLNKEFNELFEKFN
ncbi:MAG: hypothetical protein ACRC5M_02240 [Anaeroplasmataceae bacterium]